MSAAVDLAPLEFGRHPLLDGMARPHHHNYHDPYSLRHGHYAQEQQLQTAQATPLPRLPPMATMISAAGGSSHSPVLPNGRDAPLSSGKPSYYSDYATPSPVGQTPPQLPALSSDVQAMSRRTIDLRRSPALSSTASERSSDEVSQELRLRQLSSFQEQQQHHNNLPQSQQAQIPRPYFHQPSPRARADSFQQPDAALAPTIFKGRSYSPSIVPNGRPHPYHQQQQQQQQQTPHPLRSPPTTQASVSPRQEAKSMSISNLLTSDGNAAAAAAAATTTTATATSTTAASSSPRPATSLTTPQQAPRPPPLAHPDPTTSSYRITVRQQPFAARSCGFGERDRRVIDPPPIVQLSIHDPGLAADEVSRQLRHQFSVVHCSIWDEKGTRDMSSMPEDFRQQRRLMGTLVASPFVGQDEHGAEGCFFCFPDLSCRTPGSFRLKFALVVLDPRRMHMGERSAIVATAMSDVFQVYNAKDFPGMKASTLLTKRLKEQGCLISIKKGNEKREGSHGGKGKGGGGGAEEDDLDEDDEEDEGGEAEIKSRPRKRLRRSG